MRGLSIPLLLGTVAAAAGCDPCAGILGCEGSPRLSVQGEIIVYTTGEPAADVAIEFERTGGVALRHEAAHASTDPDGRFHLTVPGVEEGEVIGRLTIRPPDRPAYSVDDVRYDVTAFRGDGVIVAERWVVDPYIDFLGEIFVRSTGRSIGYGAHVTFRRTGGVPIDGDSVHAVTDHGGRFHLLPEVEVPGEVVGELTVAGVLGAAGYKVTKFPDVRLRTQHVERPLDVQGVWWLGPVLNYVGEVRVRGSGEPVVGAEVEFRRTGGIAAHPDFFVGKTDQNGRVPLIFTPASEGVLLGHVTIRPGPPFEEETIPVVELPTFEANELRLLDVWAVGPR